MNFSKKSYFFHQRKRNLNELCIPATGFLYYQSLSNLSRRSIAIQYPKRAHQQNQSATIENNEAGNRSAQQGISIRESEQNQAFPHQTQKLHRQCHS